MLPPATGKSSVIPAQERFGAGDTPVHGLLGPASP